VATRCSQKSCFSACSAASCSRSALISATSAVSRRCSCATCTSSEAMCRVCVSRVRLRVGQSEGGVTRTSIASAPRLPAPAAHLQVLQHALAPPRAAAWPWPPATPLHGRVVLLQRVQAVRDHCVAVCLEGLVLNARRGRTGVSSGDTRRAREGLSRTWVPTHAPAPPATRRGSEGSR